MKFEWEKLGLIFEPRRDLGTSWSHAQVPFTRKMNDRIRVYFSTRGQSDRSGQFISRPAYVDFSLDHFPRKIVGCSSSILELGGPGDFDHFGAMGGSVVRNGDDMLAFYTGWNRGTAVPYDWNIGLAIGDSSGTFFTRPVAGPIIGPSPTEPFLFACPVVFRVGGALRMFYLGGEKWFQGQSGGMESQYLLKSATSTDGMVWSRNGSPLLQTAVPDESQTSATVLRIDDTFYMFFSYRHGDGFRHDKEKGYRIGLAVSGDFENWERYDELCGIDVSPEGWDSEMVAYPHLFSLDNEIYMLYCGNRFGAEGFGLARLGVSLKGRSWEIVTSEGD